MDDKEFVARVQENVRNFRINTSELGGQQMHNKDESVGSVFVTDEYEKFHFLADEKGRSRNRNPYSNRAKRHQQKMKENMKRGDIYPPIWVNQDFGIVDGQNRFLAQKDLGMPIRYYFQDLNRQEQVREQNTSSGTLNWNTDDHIEYLANADNENYKEMQRFMKYTGFPLTPSKVILGGKFMSKQNFEAGNFEVADKRKAYAYADLIKENFDKHPDQHTLRAMFFLYSRLEKINVERLISVSKVWQKEIVLLKNYEKVREFIIDKYNKDLSAKNKIKKKYNESNGSIKKFFI